MQTFFADLTANLTIKVKFHLMAPYSPKLNLVEYAIHLIRQKVLHHADCKTSLTNLNRMSTNSVTIKNYSIKSRLSIF